MNRNPVLDFMAVLLISLIVFSTIFSALLTSPGVIVLQDDSEIVCEKVVARIPVFIYGNGVNCKSDGAWLTIPESSIKMRKEAP